jgi:adenylate cyclase
MLGDEVLFLADSPVDGAEIALALISRAEQADGVPSLRAGLAYGRVLSRFGDVYGSVVNIASRLTSVARPGTVLVDVELTEALRDEPGYVVRPRRPVSVRGYTRLRSAALRRAGDESTSARSDLASFTAELLGLVDREEHQHIPLVPDDEHTTPRRRG